MSANKNMEGEATGASSKKAKKVTYEKQLEEITKELLQSKSGTKKQKLRPEQEIVLLEKKCVLLLKLKKYKDVVDDGYSIIGRMGPNVTVYKCILIALVKLGKSEDDFQELLEAWKKATPKCTDMLEAKRKFDGYVAALRSGVKLSDIFSGVTVEDALNLNADAILAKQPGDAAIVAVEESKWRFRAPPPRASFSLCPRTSPPNTCMYGNECSFAHSADELKEWKTRIDADKKGGNVVTEEEKSGNDKDKDNKKNTKIFVPPTYRSLQIPPLCIHYLLDLGKRIKEAQGCLRDLLADDLAGVKIKVETPLEYRKRPDSNGRVQANWSFMVGSKMPMGTVSILHDANRDLFSITNGLYYNKKKESIGLIELHPNNKVQTKIQVLNTFIQPALFLRFNSGWPDVCYYKVEVAFEAYPPYPKDRCVRQSIVFDFKKDPKVIRNICCEILPKIEPIGNHLSESSSSKSATLLWGTSTSPPSELADCDYPNFAEERDVPPKEFTSKITDFPSLSTQFSNDVGTSSQLSLSKEVQLLDSESGKLIGSKGLFLTSTEEWDLLDHNNLFWENFPLTKENYPTWMRNFLDVELRSRQKALSRLKKKLEVKFSPTCMINPEYMYRFPFTGDLYGNIDLMSGVFCDLKMERLITSSCQSVIVSSLDVPSPFNLRKPSGRYICNIICKSKSSICFVIGGKAREDLQLCDNKLEVTFVLDNTYFDQIKSVLESMADFHLHLLFPNFENSKLPFLKVMDSIGLLNDEELLLNSRQMTVYNLVTGRKELIDGDVFTPPVLVIGGTSTGKTYLLAHCIKGIIRSNAFLRPNRILICTQTDLTADSYITDYLHQWLINDELSVQRSKPLRVYDKSRYVDSVSGAVKHYCLFDMDGLNFRYPTRDEVMSHRIIIATFPVCSELIKLTLEEDTFSHVIIDEATNCLEVECVMPIILAGRKSKIVLAGDLIQSQTNIFSISKGVPPISLLERLRNMYPFKHPFVVNLVESYVNHEVIAKFISKEFYQDQLRPASSQPSHPKYYPLNFHHIPTGEMQPGNGSGSYNLEEIRHVVDFIEELIRTWPETWGKWDSSDNKQNVVVLTPYTNHIDRLKVHLQVKGLESVNVELASNILGRKFRVVIISTVRTYKESLTNPDDDLVDSGFFSDRRLVCAALSAAKSLVVAFGDAHSLWSHGTCRDIWQKFITECQRNQSLKDLKAEIVNAGRIENSRPDAILGARESSSNISLDFNGLKPLPPGPVKELKHNSIYTNPSSLSTSGSSSPRHIMTAPSTLAHASTILPTIQPSSRMDPISSLNTQDNSWSFSSVNNDAPKTDLFSAFSTTSETLYGSKSPTAPPDLEPEKASISKLSLSDAIASFTGINKDLNPSSVSDQLQTVNKLAPIHIPTTLQSSEAFTARHEFPPLDLPGKDLENLGSKLALERERKDDLNIIEAQPMPLPVPTIPSRVLYDQNFLMNSRPNLVKPSEQGRSQFDLGNSISDNSSHKVMPTVLRGPPGFAPMTEPVFPILDDKPFPVPGSPGGTNPCNGGILPKYPYKKSTYELPPRMLRNLQLNSTNRSPMKKVQPVYSRPQPVEMNFFEELGLTSGSPLEPEVSRSASRSSASSDRSIFDMDDGGSAADEECPNVSGSDDWIEVKSTRRGKQQAVKKSTKTKSKRRSSMDKDLTSEEVAKSSEMCVDDKVEIIIQMGFSKSQAIKALQACEKDLQGAVDWLISKPSKSTS